jgi:hypothetical protein
MRLSTPRKALLVTFFATLLVFSTACIHADMGVSVQDDGSGTITLVEAIDTKAFAEAMKQFGGMLGGTSTPSNPSDIFSENDIDKSKLPAGSKVEKYKDGNYEGVKVTTPFSKPEDILPTLNKVGNALEGVGDLASLGGSTTKPSGGTARPGATPTPTKSSSGNSPSDAFDKFTLAKTSDGWKFDATAKSVGSLGDVGSDPMTAALMGSILKDASVTLTLRLPGKVAQTNADSNKNGQLQWNLPLTSTQPKTMSATTVGSGTSSGGGGDDSGFPIIIIGVVIAAVVVIGGLYYWSKQKQAQPPSPPPPPVPGTSV